MKVTFIVNGTETMVTTKSNSYLKKAAQIALEQTGNAGRHLTDFQAICDDRILNMNAKINMLLVLDAEWKNQVPINIKDKIVFLSLKAGQGA